MLRSVTETNTLLSTIPYASEPIQIKQPGWALSKLVEKHFEELTMVKAPYYALKNVDCNDPFYVKAEVVNEYLFKDEGGPISGAEFGRHIAILGSLAVAKEMSFETPHYCLATNAKLKRHTTEVYNSSYFKLKVSFVETQKRRAIIYGWLSDENNNLIYEGTVEYAIIEATLFAKLNNKYKQFSITPTNFNPYISRKDLSEITFTDNAASGIYGVVNALECVGHFDNFPALPVAVVGNLYSQLGIKLFKHKAIVKPSQVIVTHAEIRAHKLSFANSIVSVKAQIKNILPDNMMEVHGEASNEYGPFSDIRMLLKGV